jgi:hypothetical protein
MPDQLGHAILWRRLDRAGHDSAWVSPDERGWRLAGTAIFAQDEQPCRLSYRVICDADWRTVAARVEGWVGRRLIEIDLAVDAGVWRLNGTERPEVTGCLDLDLHFSPSTNLLPIRRLDLAVGQSASVTAAWLRFPEFTLEPLEQTYRRIASTTYRYESAGGAFIRDLAVNDTGFVVEYPDFWTSEAAV